jgi:hypothetical protein
MSNNEEPKTNPGGRTHTPVTLLGGDTSHVADVTISRRNGMPDVILWRQRVFARERIRDPQGVKRWTYVEVTVAEADPQ